MFCNIAQMRQPTDNTFGCDKYSLINTCIQQYLHSQPGLSPEQISGGHYLI